MIMNVVILKYGCKKISHFKGGNIGKVYRLLAFNLLNKRLDSFKVKSTEEIFIEFRKKKTGIME